jgi:hypothetical protein
MIVNVCLVLFNCSFKFIFIVCAVFFFLLFKFCFLNKINNKDILIIQWITVLYCLKLVES